MGYEQIRVEVEAPAMTIVLDRPDRMNAWTPRMQEELCDALDRADADDEVRGVIVTGEGRAFCAGSDLGLEPVQSGPGDGVTRDTGGRFALRAFESTKPLIAAINGPAIGIGVTMTLPMDVRLASAEARFGFVFARRGLVAEAASSWFLPRLVGVSSAIEWVATGRVFGIEEALGRGLVRSAHDPVDLLPEARALIVEIAENTAPVSVALSRRMIWEMLGERHPMAAHRADSRALESRVASADFAEGVASFLEKRPPRFADRVSDGLPDVMPWRKPTEFS